MHPFTRKLRELVIAGNVNQRELCRKAHIAPSTLQDYLNRGMLPRVDVLCRLAEALGVPVEQLAQPLSNDQTAGALPAAKQHPIQGQE